MKLVSFAPVLAAGLALALTAAPATAKNGGGPKPGAGATKAKVRVQPAVRTAQPSARTTAKPQGGPKARPQTTARPSTSTSARPTVGTTAKAKPVPPGQARKGAQAPVGPSTGSRPAPTGSLPPGTTLNKAQQQLAKNPKLLAKVQSRLPPDIDPMLAADGFRNLGQFMAAVNVSNNLGLPIKGLRDLMTGENPMSLGQAIQFLRSEEGPTAFTAARTATTQADADLAEVGLAPTTSVAPKKNGRR
jgi:hypothetical protein